MGGRAMRWLMVAVALGALLCGRCAQGEEQPQPTTFNSSVAFRVYAVTAGRHVLVGSTPSERPVTIPQCGRWYVVPSRLVDMATVRQEVEAQEIPGLWLQTATDTDLGELAELTALQALTLAFTEVTDAGLEHLKGLSGLRVLDLYSTQVTDEGLAHLQGLEALEVLDLGWTDVTGTGLLYLQGLRGLRSLRLVGLKTGDAALTHLEQLPALERLDLALAEVSDLGMVHLEGLTRLRGLIL
jgi:hypothetical protein